MSTHVPSLDALESNDDALLAVEVRLAKLRSQVAVVRAIADHVEHLARARHVDGLRAQLLEEMSCLGHRLVEAAAAMTGYPRPAEDSGVFELRDVLGVAE
jgi:hypothetical protein